MDGDLLWGGAHLGLSYLQDCKSVKASGLDCNNVK